MNIERHRAQGKRGGCGSRLGCIAITGVIGAGVIAAVILLLPQILLLAAGFETRGATNAVFSQPTRAVPTLVNAQSMSSNLTVNAGQFGQRQVNSSAITIQRSADGDLLHLRSDEAGLLQLCHEFSDICTPNGAQVRNATFDVRSGGVVVNGEVYLPDVNRWQRAGVVLMLDGRRVTVAGVDLNGTLLAAPPDAMGTALRDAEATANQVLAQLSVQAGGAFYTLDAIYTDEQAVTVILD